MTEQDIKTQIAHWEAMTEASDQDRQSIDLFYDTHIFPHVKDVFMQRHSDSSGPLDALICSVGTSPEPLILSIGALKPKKVLFLPTEETRHYLDRIVEESGLRPSQYEYRLIEGADVLDIYRSIYEVYRNWNDVDVLGVDISGGKKAMSVAVGLAGMMLDAQLFYVDNERFLPKARRPAPGSERLKKIDNPLAVFGDIDHREAIRLFDNGNYAGAAERWQKLVEHVPDPRRYQLFCALAQAYASWEELDFAKAEESLQALNAGVERGRVSKILPPELLNHQGLFRTQEKLAGRLAHAISRGNSASRGKISLVDFLSEAEAAHGLIREFYIRGQRRAQQSHYSDAALIHYRMVELLSQRRLALFGINVDNARYDKLDITEKSLLEQLKALYKDSDWQFRRLPRRISLVVGYAILHVLGDPLASDIDKIGEFGESIGLRNKSLFAHGFDLIDEARYKDFLAAVEKRLSMFWVAESVDEAEAQEQLAPHRFITLTS